MQIALYFLGGLIGLIIIFLVYRYFATVMATHKRDKAIFNKIKPVIDAFDNKIAPDQEIIQLLADDSASRGALHSVLSENNKTELFPDKYNNFKSGAESSLVYWLLHPNELGTRPDEIEFVQTVSKEHVIENKTQMLNYYVFKFKMNPPHWASKDGWTIGVAGPYLKVSKPYDFAPGTFSTFEKFENKSPEEHVDWVHETMNKKGQY